MNTMGRGAASVLVVAGDPAMCREICRRLRTHGYEAEGAVNGREALARLQHQDFAAVVADLSVARTYDLDLRREVQKLAGFRPWVMYTGTPDPLAARWGTHGGVFCVLIKGTPLRDLLWSIEEACRAASRVGQARCA
jgi:DNA-binding NtrC family response regulator